MYIRIKRTVTGCVYIGEQKHAAILELNILRHPLQSGEGFHDTCTIRAMLGHPIEKLPHAVGIVFDRHQERMQAEAKVDAIEIEDGKLIVHLILEDILPDDFLDFRLLLIE